MLLHQPELSVQPIHALPGPEDLFVFFSKGRVLLFHEGDAVSLPTFAQAASLLTGDFVPFGLADAQGTLLFTSHPYVECSVEENGALRYEPLRIQRTLPDREAALLAACLHLWNWYQANRFCGCCGAPNEPDAVERALRCPACGHLLFPMIAPAVIVAVTCKDHILLARNAHSSFAHYALLAGYVEVGETLEHAVRREVLEEVGLPLDTLRYLGDQPWGMSGSHMFAFHATADDSLPLRIQESELSDARWFDRAELTPREHSVSIAFKLIERFRTGTL